MICWDVDSPSNEKSTQHSEISDEREYMKQCGPLKVFSGLGYEIHMYIDC